MAFDFPANPTIGQIVIGPGGIQWTWDGVKWVSSGSSGSGASITISDTPPSNPGPGALWFDSVGLQLYVFYNDGDSEQWVPVNNQALAGFLALTGGTLTGPLILAADPTTALGAATKEYADTKMPLAGVTNGSNAAAGTVGEYISSLLQPASGPTLPGATWTTVTTLNLTAGDWDVWGEIWLAGGTIALASIYTSISTLSTGGPSAPSDNASVNALVLSVTGANTNIAGGQFEAGLSRILVTATTPVHLWTYANIISGTPQVGGKLAARRVR